MVEPTERIAAEAWGDESIRMRAVPQMYLMCATVYGDGSEGGLARLASAKPRGMRKLHWYDLKDREKARMLDAVAGIPHWNTIVIASPLDGVRQERGRRKAMERLLPRLEQRGISRLNLEGRWKQEDAADIEMAVALRNRRIIGDIRIEHCRPDGSDPRLWVPDLVLGAIGDTLCGTGNPSQWGGTWDRIDSGSVELHIVQP